MTASRIRIIVGLLITTLMLVGIVYAIDIPVENPSFTYSLSGWSVQTDGCTIEWTADGISIPGAALFTCGEDDTAALVQVVPITSSGIYTFSIASIGDADAFIGTWYSDLDREDHELAACTSTEVDVCSVSIYVPSGISSIYIAAGMDMVGTRKFDDADLSCEPEFIEPTPEPTSAPMPVASLTAFGFMLGNVIYASIGFLTLFAMLAVGMWISRIKIVGGIKQRDDD